MKITLNKEEFTRELAYVSELSSGNTDNKKDNGILFEIESDTLTLTASNASAVAVTQMKMETPVEGKFASATTARKLVDLLPLLSNETVNISFTDTKMTATAGKGRYSFQIIADASQHIKGFSVVDTKGNALSVESKSFVEGMLNADTFTATKEENQFIMTNVGVMLTPTDMHFYATDGVRAFHNVMADPSEARNATIKISNQYTGLLAKMTVADRINITVLENDAVLKFQSGQRIAFIRVQIGQMPDVINGMFAKGKARVSKHVVIDGDELKSVVRRIKIAADAKHKKVVFDISGGVLKITAKHHQTEMQEFVEEMNVEGKDEGLFVTDGNFISDFLLKTKDKVTVAFGETKKDPVLVYAQHGFNYLVSQMG
jgi:DNA polymerase III sliding clamp (beta) subunit (PCNA family)